MKAALTASKRGHDVMLFEKTDSLGGKLKFADHVSFKYSLQHFRDFLIDQTRKSSIEVKLNTEISSSNLSGFDVVIAAIGAEPIIPRIPGVQHAILATDVYGKESALGNAIVVIGGGQVGCETALHLARMGKNVTILEMQTALAPEASMTHRDELMYELEKEAETLHIILSGCCNFIDASGVTYEHDGIISIIPADSVILSVGMRPLSALADSFMGLTSEFVQAGDCIKARTVEEAIREGYFAAINL
jgi:NADPH-dependent 2,4-dienoyl-CoA reductase/sulfur reductase-like enzyme